MHDADRYHQEVAAGPLTGAVRAVLDQLHSALGQDPSATTGRDLDEAVGLIGEVQACADALDAKVVGEWDGQMRWAGHGSKSAAAALGHARRVPADGCRWIPKLARKLRGLPAVKLAWEAGRIDTAHVRRICGADNARVHDDLVADQVEIVRWAMDCHWDGFCRRLREWLDEHDLDGAEPDGRSNRRAHCSKTLHDAWAVDAWLDPIGGSIFAKELERLVAKLYEEDLAEARARLGFDPLQHHLRRTPEQRRADALVLMAERSATGPEDGRRGRILLTVLVGHDSLAKILEATNGIALRAGQLVPWIDTLTIEQVLFDGPGHVVKVSTQRNFEGIVRKAVEVRDRGCQHPTCHEPIDRCQVDHIIPVFADGPTSQENGRLLCGYHNRLRHRRPPSRRDGRLNDPGDDPDH